VYKAQVLVNGIEQAAVWAKTKEEASRMISSYGTQYLQDCKKGEEFKIKVRKCNV
jgi:hypothetical protein